MKTLLFLILTLPLTAQASEPVFVEPLLGTAEVGHLVIGDTYQLFCTFPAGCTYTIEGVRYVFDRPGNDTDNERFVAAPPVPAAIPTVRFTVPQPEAGDLNPRIRVYWTLDCGGIKTAMTRDRPIW